ncbi:MAG TPA: hypothetical protein ENN98_04875 [Desulfurivibrio alkaliphilus]|uniref:Uncharacterized protein n=1 Tax=Desulfurivibrio alkaliphilus TaxID=427923 RepID=A0A7C2XA37_9BACT|nr:hypothetical protein [Desulfurivibrio alkaliphilus]
MNQTEPFSLKDCALIAIATGRKAITLSELRDHLREVSADSIYHHFWSGLLGARFEEREFNNDFASWCRHHLREPVLAEQLSVIDPVELRDMEELRRELLDIIEMRLDGSESVHWLRASRPFEFLRSQLVIFDTGKRLTKPAELAAVLPESATGTIFYHFIDARRRLADGSDDFRFWLAGFGEDYAELGQRLAAIDPFFSSLSQVRDEMARICRQCQEESL